MLLGLAILTHRKCWRIIAWTAQSILELERVSGGRKTRRKCRYTRSGELRTEEQESKLEALKSHDSRHLGEGDTLEKALGPSSETNFDATVSDITRLEKRLWWSFQVAWSSWYSALTEILNYAHRSLINARTELHSRPSTSTQVSLRASCNEDRTRRSPGY